eukprot:15459591-Alexandrium_andersonii.AAC.1
MRSYARSNSIASAFDLLASESSGSSGLGGAGEVEVGSGCPWKPNWTVQSIVDELLCKFPHTTIQSTVKYLSGNVGRGRSQVIQVATLMAGTDSILWGLEAVERFLLDRVGKSGPDDLGVHPPLRFEQVLCCEKHHHSRAFIAANHPTVPGIFHDVVEISQAWARSGVGKAGSWARPPQACDLVVSGFSCKDASTMNANRRNLQDVIRTESGTTGVTFKGTVDYLVSSAAKLLLGENVAGAKLRVRDADGNDSGSTILSDTVQRIGDIGWVVRTIRLSSHMFHLPQHRDRIY